MPNKAMAAGYTEIRNFNDQTPRPEIYTVVPKQESEGKDGQLTTSQLNQYFNNGFLVLRDYIDKKVLDDARVAVNGLVDDIANTLYDAGKIKEKHSDKGFKDRLIYLEKEYPGTSVVMHKTGKLPDAFKAIWSNDRMLNMVEQLIGPDIAGHPVWNLRTKTPYNEQATVPWHQDNAYLSPAALDVLQVTAWIPLVDANKTNGCLQVVNEGHRKGVTATHTCCAGGTWYVDLAPDVMESQLGVDLSKDVVTCEVPYGGVLLMNNAIPHRSLENRSDMVRWSLDLRWQAPEMENGFYGLKNNVVMRNKSDSNYAIDWEEMQNKDRSKIQMETMGEDTDALKPVICGPWMRQWKTVHHNAHTKALESNQGTSWHKA